MSSCFICTPLTQNSRRNFIHSNEGGPVSHIFSEVIGLPALITAYFSTSDRHPIIPSNWNSITLKMYFSPVCSLALFLGNAIVCLSPMSLITFIAGREPLLTYSLLRPDSYPDLNSQASLHHSSLCVCVCVCVCVCMCVCAVVL